MLSSSFLGDMKVQVENLASALYQVEEIINFWVSAQKKVSIKQELQSI